MNKRHGTGIFTLATRLAHRHLGSVELRVRAIRGSNICVLAEDFEKRIGEKTVKLYAGVILVPDWRADPRRPSHKVYNDLYDAIRGVSYAMDVERIIFRDSVGRAGRYLLAFPNIDEGRRKSMKLRNEERAAETIRILQNLAAWKEAMEAERAGALEALSMDIDAEARTENGQLSEPVFVRLFVQENAALRCAPFIIYPESIEHVADRQVDLTRIVSVQMRARSLLRADALETVDILLGRAQNLLNRRKTEGADLVLHLLEEARSRIEIIAKADNVLFDKVKEAGRFIDGAIVAERPGQPRDIRNIMAKVKAARKSLAGIVVG